MRRTAWDRLILETKRRKAADRAKDRKAMKVMKKFSVEDQTKVYVLMGHGVALPRAVSFVLRTVKRKPKPEKGERVLDL